MSLISPHTSIGKVTQQNLIWGLLRAIRRSSLTHSRSILEGHFCLFLCCFTAFSFFHPPPLLPPPHPLGSLDLSLVSLSFIQRESLKLRYDSWDTSEGRCTPTFCCFTSSFQLFFFFSNLINILTFWHLHFTSSSPSGSLHTGPSQFFSPTVDQIVRRRTRRNKKILDRLLNPALIFTHSFDSLCCWGGE